MNLGTLLDPTSALFWITAGAALLILEVLMPAFLALGFGIGAWVVAVVLLIAPAGMLSVSALMLVWAVASAASWIILRVVFKNRFSGSDGGEGDINEY